MQGHTALENIPRVVISDQGTYKYILIIASQNKKEIAHFVRGDKHLEYHADNFAAFAEEVRGSGYFLKSQKQGSFKAIKGGKELHFSCPGGGRIERTTKNPFFIYGYSKSFGRVDHNIAKKLISQNMKVSEETIKTSPEGY